MKISISLGPPPSRRAKRYLHALSFLIVLVLEACATPIPAKYPPVTVPSSVDMNRLVLPLDPYTPTPFEALELGEAVVHLESRCMARHGYSFPDASTAAESTATIDGGPNSRRYGVWDINEVRLDGYHAPSQLVHAKPRTPSPALSASAQVTLTGNGSMTRGDLSFPASGCAGEAYRTLLPSIPEAMADDLQGKLVRQASAEAMSDPRVTKTWSAWRDCMADHHAPRYANPLAAASDPRFRAAKPTALEISIATSDARCKASTHVLEVWSATESAYQSALLATYRTSLLPVQKVISSEVQAARSLLKE